jgi:type II secretory pathway component PulJ
MKGLLDKLGSALTTVIVTALLAFFTMVVKNHEMNSAQETRLKVIELRLDHLEKDLDKHTDNHE